MANITTSGEAEVDGLGGREWLTVNHIGGYASSTAACLNTRKYHALLMAAMSPPVRRMALLSRVEETVISDGSECQLACSEYPGVIHPKGHKYLRAFSAQPFPRWAYQADGWTIEKQLCLLDGQNTVVLSYTFLGGGKPVRLELRPLFALRPMHELSYQWNGQLRAEDRSVRHYRIPPTSRTPEVFFAHDGEFESAGCWYMSTIYRRECERGYAGLEDLWMPGVIRWTLSPGQTVHFVCSAEPINFAEAIDQLQRQTIQLTKMPDPEGDQVLHALLQAADQFVMRLPRPEGINVVTQYPWSAPSGRDALISFAGLFMVPGRFEQGLSLLRTMVELMREGIMPSEFPEDGGKPLYQGADVSLWFIHAVHEYLRYTGDLRAVKERLFDAMVRIIRYYQSGTSLGIRPDEDGLLSSHEPGVATTWMDAKVGDWVVTARQGRTVELNALWYNALCVTAGLCREFDRMIWAGEFLRMAESVRLAFNKRFWNELAGCCFDVIGDKGVDPSVRPNQILAVSLPYPVLSPERQPAVLHKVRTELCTPFGVRTLCTSDPSYQGRYAGDVISRDRAYHQGSAYPWLLGPLATAMVKVYGRSEPTREAVQNVLQGCLRHVQNHGQIAELYDGDPPHTPGGAIASARSVAQILQAYSEHVLGNVPRGISQNAQTVELRPPVKA